MKISHEWGHRRFGDPLEVLHGLKRQTPLDQTITTFASEKKGVICGKHSAGARSLRMPRSGARSFHYTVPWEECIGTSLYRDLNTILHPYRERENPPVDVVAENVERGIQRWMQQSGVRTIIEKLPYFTHEAELQVGLLAASVCPFGTEELQCLIGQYYVLLALWDDLVAEASDHDFERFFGLEAGQKWEMLLAWADAVTTEDAIVRLPPALRGSALVTAWVDLFAELREHATPAVLEALRWGLTMFTKATYVESEVLRRAIPINLEDYCVLRAHTYTGYCSYFLHSIAYGCAGIREGSVLLHDQGVRDMAGDVAPLRKEAMRYLGDIGLLTSGFVNDVLSAYKELSLTNVLNVMYVLSSVYPGEDPVWLATRMQDAVEHVVPVAEREFRSWGEDLVQALPGGAARAAATQEIQEFSTMAKATVYGTFEWMKRSKRYLGVQCKDGSYPSFYLS